jgi:hypothetical protein
MRAIIPTLVGLVVLAATSVQAAPTPTKAHPHGKWQETPAQNVWKSSGTIISSASVLASATPV